MCLSNMSKAKVAKKDIVCFKPLYRQGEHYTGIVMANVDYREGKSQTAAFPHNPECWIHSYNRAKDLPDSGWAYDAVGRFIIVKGSKYATGTYGKHKCRVSNEIYFDKIIEVAKTKK